MPCELERAACEVVPACGAAAQGYSNGYRFVCAHACIVKSCCGGVVGTLREGYAVRQAGEGNARYVGGGCSVVGFWRNGCAVNGNVSFGNACSRCARGAAAAFGKAVAAGGIALQGYGNGCLLAFAYACTAVKGCGGGVVGTQREGFVSCEVVEGNARYGGGVGTVVSFAGNGGGSNGNHPFGNVCIRCARGAAAACGKAVAAGGVALQGYGNGYLLACAHACIGKGCGGGVVGIHREGFAAWQVAEGYARYVGGVAAVVNFAGNGGAGNGNLLFGNGLPCELVGTACKRVGVCEVAAQGYSNGYRFVCAHACIVKSCCGGVVGTLREGYAVRQAGEGNARYVGGGCSVVGFWRNGCAVNGNGGRRRKGIHNIVYGDRRHCSGDTVVAPGEYQ